MLVFALFAIAINLVRSYLTSGAGKTVKQFNLALGENYLEGLDSTKGSCNKHCTSVMTALGGESGRKPIYISSIVSRNPKSGADYLKSAAGRSAAE